GTSHFGPRLSRSCRRNGTAIIASTVRATGSRCSLRIAADTPLPVALLGGRATAKLPDGRTGGRVLDWLGLPSGIATSSFSCRGHVQWVGGAGSARAKGHNMRGPASHSVRAPAPGVPLPRVGPQG